MVLTMTVTITMHLDGVLDVLKQGAIGKILTVWLELMNLPIHLDGKKWQTRRRGTMRQLYKGLPKDSKKKG